MKCLKCGAELQENDLFCPKCGEKVQIEKPNETLDNNGFFTYEKPDENAQNNNIEFNTLQASSNNQQNDSQQSNNQQNYNQPNYNQPNYNQPNYNQPNYNQPNYNQQNYNQPNNFNPQQQNQVNNGGQAPKKKSNTLLIFLIVLLIIILIVTGIVFLCRKVMKSFKEKSILGTIFGSEEYGDQKIGDTELGKMLDAMISGEYEEDENAVVANITSGNDKSVKVDKKDSKQVDYEGVRFYIPNNLEYETENGLVLKDNTNRWYVSLSIDDGKAEEYLKEYSWLRPLVLEMINSQQSDFKVTKTAEATVNGVDYVLMECESGGEHPVIATTKLDSDHGVRILVVAGEGKVALPVISEIIKEAEPID